MTGILHVYQTALDPVLDISIIQPWEDRKTIIHSALFWLGWCSKTATQNIFFINNHALFEGKKMQVKSKIGCQYLTSWKNENDYMCYCDMSAFSPLTQWFVVSCRTGQRKITVSCRAFWYLKIHSYLVGNKLAVLGQSAQAVWQLPSCIPVPWDPDHTPTFPFCHVSCWHGTALHLQQGAIWLSLFFPHQLTGKWILKIFLCGFLKLFWVVSHC